MPVPNVDLHVAIILQLFWVYGGKVGAGGGGGGGGEKRVRKKRSSTDECIILSDNGHLPLLLHYRRKRVNWPQYVRCFR